MDYLSTPGPERLRCGVVTQNSDDPVYTSVQTGREGDVDDRSPESLRDLSSCRAPESEVWSVRDT